jgi:serine protease inhibitor
VVNDFGFRLLREAVQPDAKATLNSPASLFIAMAIVYSATRGQTQHEVAKALGLQLGEVESAASAMLAVLTTNQPAGYWASQVPELRLATALWVRRNLSITPAFYASNNAVYHAELASVDFADGALVSLVNDWAAHQTKNKIRHVVDEFHPLTTMCLASVLYLQGVWHCTFDVGSTKEEAFHTTNGHAVTVPMMAEGGWFSYVEHEDFQAIRLPLEGETVDVTIVLPAVTSGVAAVYSRLDASNWDQWLARMWLRKGTVMLPRFSIEYSAEPSLVPHLAALGMQRAFDPIEADFSGLFGAAKPEDPPVFIDQIIHKTRLDVDENGIEAAAVTMAGLAGGLPFPDQEEPFSMIVNRPFLCAIRHVQSGALLFLGVVDDPS